MHLCNPVLNTAPGTWWEGRKGRRKKGRKERGREEGRKGGWEESRRGKKEWEKGKESVLHLSAQLVYGKTETVA